VTTASSTSLLPIGMQTPVASMETSGGRSTWLWGMPFLTATAVFYYYFLLFLSNCKWVITRWQWCYNYTTVSIILQLIIKKKTHKKENTNTRETITKGKHIKEE
jgi:hypothetical protein